MPRLGEILIAAGVITQQQLERALESRRERMCLLGVALMELGFAEPAEIAGAVARQLGMLLVHRYNVVIDTEAGSKLTHKFCREAQILPVQVAGRGLVLAMIDPMDLTSLDRAREILGGELTPAVMSPAEMANALAEMLGIRATVDSFVDQLGISESVHFVQTAVRGNAEDEDEDAAPTVRIVGAVIADAIGAKASDIHIEPRDDIVQVRYRIDGRLRHTLALPLYAHASMVSRIKVMSDMDITETRMPQDGRLKAHYSGRVVDMRVSTLPTSLGEKAVLRILDRASGVESLRSAGFEQTDVTLIEDALSRPQGCVLATGPTGSGKTTTLYACLNTVLGDDVNIITIEDPVERSVPGVNQVQILEAAGMTFSSALRSVLRQDPDVVMVGEIRDQETAEISMRAALTGHLVLSSLHTNDAVSTIMRLMDMGIEGHLIASALSLVIAQRLVRRICPLCRTEAEPDIEVLARAERTLGGMPRGPFFIGAGCRECGDTGFSGRTVVYEVLAIRGDLERLISRGAAPTDTLACALRMGMTPMFEVALAKANVGVTTLDEVLRHVPPPEGVEGVQVHEMFTTEAEKVASSPPEEEHPSGPRVLVVDDDRVSRLLAERLLTNAGMRCIVAESAEQALEMLTSTETDVIVTDMVMPGMDGIEFTQRVRSLPQTAAVPVLLCSASQDREIISRALHAGVDDCLFKPLDAQSLVRGIRAVALRRSTPAVDDIEEVLRRLQLEDQAEFYMGLLEGFWADVGQALADIAECLRSDDAAGIGVVARRIEGAAASLGVEPVREAAERVAEDAEGGSISMAIDHLAELRRALARVAPEAGPAK